MQPLFVLRNKPVGVFALILSALCLIPSLSHARDFQSDQSSVRFVAEPAALGPQPFLGAGAIEPIKVGDFNRGPLRLDLTLTPHGSVGAVAGGELTSGGAELRLSASSKGDQPEDGSWFLFAGAKGQAVSWDMGSSGFDLGDFVQLKQRETVGDFQMGVGYQMGGAQVSFGVMRQSYKVSTSYRRSYTDRQDVAGLSVAWRR